MATYKKVVEQDARPLFDFSQHPLVNGAEQDTICGRIPAHIIDRVKVVSQVWDSYRSNGEVLGSLTQS